VILMIAAVVTIKVMVVRVDSGNSVSGDSDSDNVDSGDSDDDSDG
jgi:hypothetical protein